jgi:hypothetical protein
MIVKFVINKAFDYNVPLKDQLIMSLLIYYHINSGTNPQIEINKQSVKIKYSDDEILIKF